MNPQRYIPKDAETDELRETESAKDGDEELEACRECRRAAYHRQETERVWAAAGTEGAVAVIRALKAENAALAQYNRVLIKSHAPVPCEKPRPDPGDSPLTRREHEVLEMLAYGKTTKEIGYLLGIAFKTAVCHRYRLMEKLGVHTGAELVRVAVELGLIRFSPAGRSDANRGVCAMRLTFMENPR